MKKIVTIVGARPQFIKASALSRALSKSSITEVLIHTGQHYDSQMSDVFFKELEIPAPAYNLNIGSGPHGQQTGKMLGEIEAVLQKEGPDYVVVYGDTNSTLAGALAAVKLHIPIVHIEAGLRSFNRAMPEEINRILTDTISSILFCSTQTAIDNLHNEGVKAEIHQCGDIMYDVALWASEKIADKNVLFEKYKIDINKKLLFATIHRAENTNDPARLKAILLALNELTKNFTVLFPIHPRTVQKIKDFNCGNLLKNITITEPLSFFETVFFEKNASVIVTDSGGIQKEAYFHKTPCVTVRTETEWVETVTSGWNILANPDDTKSIVDAVLKSLDKDIKRTTIDEYGMGNTAERIVEILNNKTI